MSKCGFYSLPFSFLPIRYKTTTHIFFNTLLGGGSGRQEKQLVVLTFTHIVFSMVNCKRANFNDNFCTDLPILFYF